MKLSELIQFQQFAAPNLELLSENREKSQITIESIQASVKALTDAVNNDSQVDTISAAVLELSDKLAKQGERIVGQDKTIAVAEHRDGLYLNFGSTGFFKIFFLLRKDRLLLTKGSQ
jgi:hypothetical protein